MSKVFKNLVLDAEENISACKEFYLPSYNAVESVERRFGGICRRYFPPKRRLKFNGLHGIISQKTELFITTGVRTSNPITRK
jgi:hypothetical protein